MTSQPEFFCPSCAAVVAFEQPPCPDGHEECPDQVCTLCGTAVFAGVLAAGPGRRARPGTTCRDRRATAGHAA